MHVLKFAIRLFFPSNSNRTLSIFACALLSGPAYLAEYTPGAPFNVSISKPESSAKQSCP